MGNNMSAYEILSVTEESPNKEIKEQYIKMCKIYHEKIVDIINKETDYIGKHLRNLGTNKNLQ